MKARAMELIDRHISKIAELCKAHNVRRMSVFGSATTPQFSATSDVDLLVEFDTPAIADYFDNYYNLKEALQQLIGRDIDLVEEQTLKNPFMRQSVEQQRRLIYG